MKIAKFTLSIFVVLAFVGLNNAMGQWATSGTNIYNTNSGNVGIGTTSPGFILDVHRFGNPQVQVKNTGGSAGATFRMVDQLSGADFAFKSTTNGGFKIRDNANSLDVFFIEANSAANVIYINAAGNLGVGTTNPTEKLSINGNIRCKQVEVSLTGWADFVFEEDYDLMPLNDVEAFIKQNKHLPGVPSADEVMTNGANLGEMDAILLQKIEELTLYLIELKKENEALKSLISK